MKVGYPQEDNRPTFDVSNEGVDQHVIGNKFCTEGWCGSTYPIPCQCGGLIHADFGDEDREGNYWLILRCDRCGERYDDY
jgi:hypothetical protein